MREQIKIFLWQALYLLLKSYIPSLQLYRTDNRFKHVKSQGMYVLIMDARLEKTGEVMVLYQSLSTGTLWIRNKVEFFDGWFVLCEDD